MSVSASTAALECPGQLLLLWSDETDSASRKEPVDLLEARFEEVVIRSARKVRETTQVYLMGEQYTGNGIVRNLRKDDKWFILTIQIDEASPFRHNSELDPGVFAVDDFLTEQQEAEILSDLGNDIHMAPSCAT
jgi:hypothetical protein